MSKQNPIIAADGAKEWLENNIQENISTITLLINGKSDEQQVEEEREEVKNELIKFI